MRSIVDGQNGTAFMNLAASTYRPQNTDGGKSESSASLLRRSDASLKAGRAEEAERFARLLLEADATHVGGLESLAKAQWQLNQYNPLLDTLARLVRINPYEPGYHTLRGQALRNLGRYGEAVRAFVRAGNAPGAEDAVVEISALQSDLVLHLLDKDPVFRAEYGQDPEKACTARGFEFGSETKIRHWVLSNDYSRTRLLERPS
jgi:tetratricopeptide (TPR) repeat protein